MSDIELNKNERGFMVGHFIDIDGESCSIQESSLATESALWLGLDKGTHHRGECFARMHLSTNQVKSLIPLLQRFVDNGELSVDMEWEQMSDAQLAFERGYDGDM